MSASSSVSPSVKRQLFLNQKLIEIYMTFKRVELGDLVRDQVTLFKGIAIQKVYYLQGCARFGVQPQGLDNNGKVKETMWFDEPALEVLKKAVVPVDPRIIEETRIGGAVFPVPSR